MKISIEEVSRVLALTPTDRAVDTTALPSLTDVPAAEVQKVKEFVDKLPDVREDRVKELKAQVDSGTYSVAGEDIADLMIRRTLADNTAL